MGRPPQRTFQLRFQERGQRGFCGLFAKALDEISCCHLKQNATPGSQFFKMHLKPMLVLVVMNQVIILSYIGDAALRQHHLFSRSYPFLTEAPTPENWSWECKNGQGWSPSSNIATFESNVWWILSFFGWTQKLLSIWSQDTITPHLRTSHHLQFYNQISNDISTLQNWSFSQYFLPNTTTWEPLV